MTELVYLERKHWGLYASLYESGWGGYAFRKMVGYSVTGAVRELRRCGVKCPRRAYEDALKGRA